MNYMNIDEFTNGNMPGFLPEFQPYEKSGSSEKSKKRNKGIICDVRNCMYHDGVGKCMAKEIAVGPSYATSSTDTVCATFRPKQL